MPYSLGVVWLTISAGLRIIGQNAISFDLFVQSCISLKRMTEVFKRYDDDRDGFITLSFEEFLTGTRIKIPSFPFSLPLPLPPAPAPLPAPPPPEGC